MTYFQNRKLAKRRRQDRAAHHEHLRRVRLAGSRRQGLSAAQWVCWIGGCTLISAGLLTIPVAIICALVHSHKIKDWDLAHNYLMECQATPPPPMPAPALFPAPAARQHQQPNLRVITGGKFH